MMRAYALVLIHSIPVRGNSNDVEVLGHINTASFVEMMIILKTNAVF